MNEKEIKSISKFLSLLLRHEPETIGLQLDGNGWADVNELLQKSKLKYPALTKEILDIVVATNEKKRFAYNEDGSRIRANQGHSVDVALNIPAQEPPTFLYHGTVGKFIDAIKAEGLKKMDRQHVHLSADKATAINVGSRRGMPVVLVINAGQMAKDGYLFYLSENGVWLTDAVAAQYINYSIL